MRILRPITITDLLWEGIAYYGNVNNDMSFSAMYIYNIRAMDLNTILEGRNRKKEDINQKLNKFLAFAVTFGQTGERLKLM